MTIVIGAPMPAGTNLHRLAASLARPVARGWLSSEAAKDSLAVLTMRAKRKGTLGPYQPGAVFDTLCFTLDQRLKSEENKRDLATHHVRRAVAPMIAARQPSRALLAEAHGVNGAAGFPLTEDEVGEAVRIEVWWSLPAGGRHHG